MVAVQQGRSMGWGGGVGREVIVNYAAGVKNVWGVLQAVQQG